MPLRFSTLLPTADVEVAAPASGSAWLDVPDSSSESVSDVSEPRTAADQERLEWQATLTSVLGGDAFVAEKTRVAAAVSLADASPTAAQNDIWLGIRARLHDHSVYDEQRYISAGRDRGPASIARIIQFCTVDSDDGSLRQVEALLAALDRAESCYPNHKMFLLDNPSANDSAFRTRRDALCAWSTSILSLRQQLGALQRWTGSLTLDVSQPFHAGTPSLGGGPDAGPFDTPIPAVPTRTFVDRVLKDEALLEALEQLFLCKIPALVARVRDAQLTHIAPIAAMALPRLEPEAQALVAFPAHFMRAFLRTQVDDIRGLKEPSSLVVETVTKQLVTSVGLACALKKQYSALSQPTPESDQSDGFDAPWNLPQCMDHAYDIVVLLALDLIFDLMHWKLKNDTKAVSSEDTTVLEAHWSIYSDVSWIIPGGSALIADRLSALTRHVILHTTRHLEVQTRIPLAVLDSGFPATPPDLHIPFAAHQSGLSPQLSDIRSQTSSGTSILDSPATPSSPPQLSAVTAQTVGTSDEQLASWFQRVLDTARLRVRKLARFVQRLLHGLSNSAEYSMQNLSTEELAETLADSGHVLIYTDAYQSEGRYVLASPALADRMVDIPRILAGSFHMHAASVTDDAADSGTSHDEALDGSYLLLWASDTGFTWSGDVAEITVPHIPLTLKDGRVRLVAVGAGPRLHAARESFESVFSSSFDEHDTDEGHHDECSRSKASESRSREPSAAPDKGLRCISRCCTHVHGVSAFLRKLGAARVRWAEALVEAVLQIRARLQGTLGTQSLVEDWFSLAAEQARRAHADVALVSAGAGGRLRGTETMLSTLAIGWLTFVCDDCAPGDRRTFVWALRALDFALHQTSDIVRLARTQFEALRAKVGRCMELLVNHYDVLGVRALKRAVGGPKAAFKTAVPAPLRSVFDRHETDFAQAVAEVESARARTRDEQGLAGRVLETDEPGDQSVIFLASALSNISMRWQQGALIGAGAFGSVYVALDLDTGNVMAVKELRFIQGSAGAPGAAGVHGRIAGELEVMEMLRHPSIAEYYGIEVHRDKVYLFQEYCQGGSLGQLLMHGPIEDERIVQIYTMQMLEGVAYLHANGIAHRDIKPDNILLDAAGTIKFVDFGAASGVVGSRRGKTLTTKPDVPPSNPMALAGGLGVNVSFAGTPMYMAPEIIKNTARGEFGAMDIWSIGCVVLHCFTGREPWAALKGENQWAIIFHLAITTEPPSLPDPGVAGLSAHDLIRRCLAVDPTLRADAKTLLEHAWMRDCRDMLQNYAGVARPDSSSPDSLGAITPERERSSTSL